MLVPLSAALIYPSALFISSQSSSEPAAADGTTIRLLRYSLDGLDAGLYDADSDDSRPFDNRNTTWFGQPVPLVWRKLSGWEGGPPDAVINGGFFGARGLYVAEHEAPIVVSGRAYYDIDTLKKDWPDQACTLAWSHIGKRLTFALLENAPFQKLDEYEGALSGVRALLHNRREFDLDPGMGGTNLMTDRTSVGWDEKFVYILIVRDPDGEASSVRAKKSKSQQFGGWDVRQVAKYWKHLGVPNAVLFDGGESTQVGFRDSAGTVQMVHSSYFFTRTPLFIRQRPLRFVYPMLPPYQANGGVLNWFWVKSRKKTH